MDQSSPIGKKQEDKLHDVTLVNKVAEGQIRSILVPNENIVYVAKMHWIMFAASCFYILTGIALWLFDYFWPNAIYSFFPSPVLAPYTAFLTLRPIRIIAVGVIVFGVLHLIYDIAKHEMTQIIVTNDRLIHKKGVFSFIFNQVLIMHVLTVDVDQSQLGLMLGYGEVKVKGGEFTEGGGVLEHVENPFNLAQAIMQSRQNQLHSLPQMQIIPPDQGALPISPHDGGNGDGGGL